MPPWFCTPFFGGEYNKIGILLLKDKAQAFYLAPVFCAAFHNINSCGFDAGVAEKVRQLCYIPGSRRKGLGEQMPEVVGKDLPLVHPRPGTESLEAPARCWSGPRAGPVRVTKTGPAVIPLERQ